jgi:hypothetical protein
MRKVAIVVLFLFAAAAVAGCSSRNEESAGTTAGGGGEGAVADKARGTSVGSARQAVGGGSSAAPQVRLSVPEVGPQIVKTASLRLSIKRGDFDATIEEAGSIAAGLGGFVVSSSASQGSEQRLVRGTIVVRVPARSYDDAISSLRALGKVDARSENGQDVSQEFVDLQARIRQLQAVESQLLELLDDANTVGAALAVQRQLSEVQLQLEQARGRLQYLDDQVAFATISLAIHERIVAVPKTENGGFGILDAWSKAGHGFLTVIGWTFVVLATAAPLILLLVAAFFLGRALIGSPRLRRRPV